MLIKTPTSLLEDDINNLFEKKSVNDIDILFSIVTLILFKNEKNTDMLDLFKNTELDTFLKLINLFNGRTVKFMDSKTLKDTMILSLCYYLREVEGEKNWEKIQSFFGSYTIDRLSIALKIHNMDEWIKQKITEQLKNISQKEKEE